MWQRKTKPVMTSNRSYRESRRLMGVRGGFTILEVVLALLVFSLAVVALVELINLSGVASTESRLDGRIQQRMETMLTEVTRLSQKNGPDSPPEELDTTVTEDGVKYHIKTAPLELKSMEDQPVVGIYGARITATWQESAQMRTVEAETWFWPPLFQPAR